MVFLYVLWVLFGSVSTGACAAGYYFDRPDAINHIGSSEGPVASLVLSDPSITVGVDTGVLAGPIDLRGGRMVVHRDTVCDDDTTFQTNGQLVGMRVGGVHYPQLRLPTGTAAYQLPEGAVYGGVQEYNDIFADRAIGCFAWSPTSHNRYAMTDGQQLIVGNRIGRAYQDGPSVTLPASGADMYWSPTNPVGVVHTQMTSGERSLHFFRYDEAAGEISVAPLGTHAGQITTAAWSPDGTKFVAAEYNQSQQSGWKMHIAVYSYQDGALELLTRRYFHEAPGGAFGSTVYKVLSCAWRDDGNALLLGCGWEEEDGSFVRRRSSQVLLFDVRADDITKSGSIDNIDANVTALTFVPGQAGRCLIGLSCGGGGNRLRSCTVHDSADGIPLLQRERSYPFRYDIHRMQSNAEGSMLAVGNHGTPTTSGAIRLYLIDGLNITECSRCEHESQITQLGWNAAGTMLTTVLQSMVCDLSVLNGMVFENIRVIGDSPLAVSRSLQFRGKVQLDGEGRVWRTPAGAEWECADGSVVRLSNLILEAADDLTISGSDQAVCQMYDVTLQNGTLYCQAPVEVVTLLRVHGSLVGTLACQDYSKVMLIGDTTIQGTLVIDGNVTIEGAGHLLDMSQVHLDIRPGSLVRFKNTRLHGLRGDVVMDAASTIEFTEGSIVTLVESGQFAAGTFSVIQSTLLYQHWQYYVTNFSFVADGTKELWHEAQKQGVWSTPGAPTGTGTTSPAPSGAGTSGTSSGSPGSSPVADAASSGGSVLSPSSGGSAGTTSSSSSGAPISSVSTAPITQPPGSSAGVPAVPAVIPTGTGMGVIEITTPHYYLQNDLFLAPDAPGVMGTQLHIKTNTTIHGNFRRIMCAMNTDGPLITVDSMCTVTFVDVGVYPLRPDMIAPTGRNTTAKVVWGQNVWVTLGGSGMLQLPWHMSGNAHLDGNGHSATLSPRGTVVVDSASNVVIERVTFNNVLGTNLAASDDSTIVTLANVTCHLHGTMRIPVGEWNFHQNVSFVGPYGIVYQSSKQATIHDGCTLVFDNGSTDAVPNDYSTPVYAYNHSTFVYEPSVDRVDGVRCLPLGAIGLYNSELFCNDSSLHLESGRVIVDGEVTLREEGNGALVLGGAGSDDDGSGPRVSLERRSGSSRVDVHVFGHIVMSLPH